MTSDGDQPRWLDEREQRAWRGLLAMNAELAGRLRRALQRDAGLSDADYHVLVQLSESPDGRMRVFELVRALQWEKSRLSHHLRRMEERGLVDREECPTDGRGAFVVLTGTGRAAIEAAAPKHAAEVRHAFIDALTPEQLDALAGIASAVLANLAATEQANGAAAGHDGAEGGGGAAQAGRSGAVSRPGPSR